METARNEMERNWWWPARRGITAEEPPRFNRGTDRGWRHAGRDDLSRAISLSLSVEPGHPGSLTLLRKEYESPAAMRI